MTGLFKRVVMAVYLITGKGTSIYRAICKPNGLEWANVLRHRGYPIGAGTSISPFADMMDLGGVSIGHNCSISKVQFVTHSGGDRIIRNYWGVYVDSALQRPIVIGDNVVIGASVTIMYGVTIGDNCVIGAGSYISRDVPANTVTRPPEATHAGKTDDYVARLVKRTQERQGEPPQVLRKLKFLGDGAGNKSNKCFPKYWSRLLCFPSVPAQSSTQPDSQRWASSFQAAIGAG